jgi:hypothetical protein
MTVLLSIVYNILKMFGRPFCFAYISTGENENILIFPPKDVPLKALQKLYKQIPIAK